MKEYTGNPWDLTLEQQQNLEILDCYSLNLTSIPNTLINLTILYCYNNQITSIPDTLINLTHLDCSNNQIKSLGIYNLNYIHGIFNNDIELYKKRNNKIKIIEILLSKKYLTSDIMRKMYTEYF